MVNWVVTANIRSLIAEFNRAFPDRGKASDGTIGDYAHSQGISGHNPDDTSLHNAEWDNDPDNVPEVRACDIDVNLNGPVDMHDVINMLRRRPNLGSVLWYIIYDHVIYEGPNFEPVNYTGTDPHTGHAHFSGAKSQTADNNGAFPWGVADYVEEVTMPSADEIAEAVAKRLEIGDKPDGLMDKMAKDYGNDKSGMAINFDKRVENVVRKVLKEAGVI